MKLYTLMDIYIYYNTMYFLETLNQLFQFTYRYNSLVLHACKGNGVVADNLCASEYF